jgi:tRNA-2-methylthio-N6-dimethylallyladenosine synthase
MKACGADGNDLGRVFIKTYGCQMNERDSEAAGALLLRAGYRLAADEQHADIVIVNTCSVREKAEAKAIGKLRLLATPRKKGGRIVGAVGCMVQRLGADTAGRINGLDFAIGTHRLHTLPAVIEAVRAGRGPIVDAAPPDEDREPPSGHLAGGCSAFVNILLGCDRHCTYCIVPAVRGREWSRPGASVLREVRALASQNVREVTLLGQSVISYGRVNGVWPADHASPRDFREPLPRLLEAVAAVPGIRRVRFTSGHPSGCTPELARAMREVPGVCDHLHLPVQSGSDRVLKRMHRGYTAAAYLEAVAQLRAAVPTLALTSDIIVGFPGETEEDFEQTRVLLEAAQFDNAYIFKYSPREGTPAARWPDDVTAEEKLRRNHVLLRDLDRWGLAINGALAGKTLAVLAEGPSLRNAERWAGRTTTNKIVIFEPRPGLEAGDIVDVHIERVAAQTLYGTLADGRQS